jgi:hypothetical protein
VEIHWFQPTKSSRERGNQYHKFLFEGETTQRQIVRQRGQAQYRLDPRTQVSNKTSEFVYILSLTKWSKCLVLYLHKRIKFSRWLSTTPCILGSASSPITVLPMRWCMNFAHSNLSYNKKIFSKNKRSSFTILHKQQKVCS